MPPPVRASSAESRPKIEPILALLPGPIHEGVPRHLTWSDRSVPPPYRLVICDDTLKPLATFDDLGTTSMALPDSLATELAVAGGFSWYIEGYVPATDGTGRRVRSPLARCEIR